MRIKAGDTFPNVGFDLNADISAASSVRFRLWKADSHISVIDELASVSDAANGIGAYEWQAGDTDVPGYYQGEVLVTFASGDIQRFPQRGYLEVLISESIPIP